MAGRARSTGRRAAIGLAALVAMVAMATGCGADSSAGRDTGIAATTGSSSMGTPTPGDSSDPARALTQVSSAPGEVPAGLRSAVDVAVADLAGRSGVDPALIVTVSARDVTWPDGGIGCPQPGMSYAQVQVDGAEIILQAGGVTYRYTLGGTRGPMLCENA
ncbi:MAG: hypothetical protein QM733_23840 [Ilumatobacteraceae bacterium]